MSPKPYGSQTSGKCLICKMREHSLLHRPGEKIKWDNGIESPAQGLTKQMLISFSLSSGALVNCLFFPQKVKSASLTKELEMVNFLPPVGWTGE